MRKFIIGMIFFVFLVGNIYSQNVVTSEFMFFGNDVPTVNFESTIAALHDSFLTEGFLPFGKLPNSVINERNHQLRDYDPLNNGQVFYCLIGVIRNSGISGEVFRVFFRITDANNSKWEYFAYIKTF